VTETSIDGLFQALIKDPIQQKILKYISTCDTSDEALKKILDEIEAGNKK
jgi:hypothetical protein